LNEGLTFSLPSLYSFSVQADFQTARGYEGDSKNGVAEQENLPELQ
jgi:hypothetical protein